MSTCWPEQPMLQHLGAAADLGDTSAAAADGWKSCCPPLRGGVLCILIHFLRLCTVFKIAIFARNRVGNNSQMIDLKIAISRHIQGANKYVVYIYESIRKVIHRFHVITETNSDTFSKSAF